VKLFTSILTAYGLVLSLFLSTLFAGCSTPGIYHPVQSGETLTQIARAYGRNESLLARVNGIDSPQPLHQGERLFIPGATALRRTAATPPRELKFSPSAEPVVTASGRHPAIGQKMPGKDDNHEKKSREKSEKILLPEVTRGRFAWPLQGSVLRRYGDQKPFPCKGIEIAAPPGTPVLAAAAGRVIYSGDGISSFGNMIILRHDGDFYSVYAFTQENFVKVGSFVSQRERIALSGVPPQSRSPRLYFELRFHKEPVDPTFYLP